MGTLQQQIIEHRQALADLGGRVDRLEASVDAVTGEARELLAVYQERKRAASEALGAAGSKFLLARRALAKAGALFSDLEALKAAHISLSHLVNGFLRTEGDGGESRRVLREFTRARRLLRAAYLRLQRCQEAARLGDEDDVDRQV